MKALAVIPARGGSKRLPGKNIRDFAGKPMLAWSVGAALDCGLFDTVMVDRQRGNRRGSPRRGSERPVPAQRQDRR